MQPSPWPTVFSALYIYNGLWTLIILEWLILFFFKSEILWRPLPLLCFFLKKIYFIVDMYLFRTWMQPYTGNKRSLQGNYKYFYYIFGWCLNISHDITEYDGSWKIKFINRYRGVSIATLFVPNLIGFLNIYFARHRTIVLLV